MEINTRVWLKRFLAPKRAVSVNCIPDSYWLKQKEKGIDYIWLMGIWQPARPELVSKYCFEEGLKSEYSRALPDWQPEDVIGSPYAVDVYQPNPELSTIEGLKLLKGRLNRLGLKLILDFVPNHFSAGSPLLKTHPGIFLSVNEEHYHSDQDTFYVPEESGVSGWFAHGRDPYFPAWKDTVQVNYFSSEARDYMKQVLVSLTDVCDGLRCDMAMLALNEVFENTWGRYTGELGYFRPETEFWSETIHRVKQHSPEFLFIAEAYWDLEWQLQQLGFDFTYDRSMMERLRQGQAQAVKEHLWAEKDYQQKSVRFLENHDELRSAAVMEEQQLKAAAVIAATIQGLCFYHDGQFQGLKTRLPVQLGREPVEEANPTLKKFYAKLLKITKEPVFKQGSWQMLQVDGFAMNDENSGSLLAWEWRYAEEKRLVVVNYSAWPAKGHVRADFRGPEEEALFTDLLSQESYSHLREFLDRLGLYVELQPFQSHIFSY